ncbi:MAG: gliding motility protein GldL [Muribaculaceae bacterium]|nr:gliding motility protein GldL [Muribaculaceae bacterium]MDE6229538.1 gliding motility protein GldL [Muribaculaceae bacterium]
MANKKIKKYKNAVERFLSGESGQRFFNFAYSIGAAIVIWGALFKLLHLPGGNLLLMIGMGTEVFMFIISAFDRPAKQYHWEEVFPVLDTHDAQDRPDLQGGNAGGGVVITGGMPAGAAVASGAVSPAAAVADQPLALNASAKEATEHYVAQIAALSEQMADLRKSTEALNKVTAVLLESYNAITENSDKITASSQGYVEEMTALNRHVAGLNTIYEIQLKSVSSQLDSIDRVNNGIKDIRDMYERSADTSRQYCEETERMARYMQQLNAIYAQMIQAMTQNMPGGAPKA